MGEDPGSTELRTLIVEDRQDDADLLVHELGRSCWNDARVGFIQKPLTPDVLLRTIRETLEA